jgi:hypothetical protein
MVWNQRRLPFAIANSNSMTRQPGYAVPNCTVWSKRVNHIQIIATILLPAKNNKHSNVETKANFEDSD